MSELDDLKKQVNELKDQLNPPPRPPSTHAPRDYTEGMSMPRSAMQAMIDAVPERLMRDLRADALKPNPVTGGTAPQSERVQRRTGWHDPAPLGPPPGVAIADRLVDQQDQIDKAELAVRLAKAAAMEAAAKGGGK
jgi:hypothetical protein